MSFFIIHNAKSANLLISAYLLDGQNIKIVCRVSGYCKSVIIRWRYRYINTNEYCECLARQIYYDNDDSIWEGVVKVWKCDINFIIGVYGTDLYWYSEVGKNKHIAEALPFSFIIPMIRKNDLCHYLPNLPSWLRGCTLYEVFVDRYRKHKDKPGNLSWQNRPPGNDFYHKATFGGSLQGILHSLAFDGKYLQTLGIGCIYMTPIFQSPSNHKYDTEDYYNIDGSFGDKKDLVNLVNVAHDNNIRVILDGVFNHCSENLRVEHNGQNVSVFKDIETKGEKSFFYNWAERNSDGSIRGFANLSHIPILNTMDIKCANYLTGVVEYWTKLANIDGWRLDVANELGDDFVKSIKEKLNAMPSSKWLLGEILHDGNHWVNSEMLQGITNHHWRELVIDYLKGNISSAFFDGYMHNLWLQYPSTFQIGVVNYLSNHDTERIMTAIGMGDDYSVKIKKSAIAAVLLFTFPGTPMVYYGDEIGMEGGSDPDCRKRMEWDETLWEHSQAGDRRWLREVYSRLIHFRREKRWLADGAWHTIYGDSNQLLVYKRLSCRTLSEGDINAEEAIIVLNPTSLKMAVQLGGHLNKSKYTDLMSGKECSSFSIGQLFIPPYSFYVFSS